MPGPPNVARNGKSITLTEAADEVIIQTRFNKTCRCWQCSNVIEIEKKTLGPSDRQSQIRLFAQNMSFKDIYLTLWSRFCQRSRRLRRSISRRKITSDWATNKPAKNLFEIRKYEILIWKQLTQEENLNYSKFAFKCLEIILGALLHLQNILVKL